MDAELHAGDLGDDGPRCGRSGRGGGNRSVAVAADGGHKSSCDPVEHRLESASAEGAWSGIVPLEVSGYTSGGSDVISGE
jgi:hypothetical protein